jgi:DNA-binding transcriptional LysR family regulator
MMAEPFKNLAWDDFRLIKAVADARGLPAAAAQIGVNHSTVFRRLKQIEDTLGNALFERHRTGYALTPAGEEMVALANRLDDEITAVGRKLAGREPTPAGELRVTTNDSLLIHLLMPLLAGFRERYPEVRLDVVLTNQALNLSKRDADVAIRATDQPPENLVGRRAARIAWALYGRAIDFPEPGAIDQEELKTRDWVSLGDNLAQLKAVKFVQENVAPERVAYKINTVLGLAEAVEVGLGIGHLPCLIGDSRPTLVRLAPPDPAYAADLWLLTHPDLRHAPRVRAFLDYLAIEFGKLRRFIEGNPPGPVVEAVVAEV